MSLIAFLFTDFANSTVVKYFVLSTISTFHDTVQSAILLMSLKIILIARANLSLFIAQLSVLSIVYVSLHY